MSRLFYAIICFGLFMFSCQNDRPLFPEVIMDLGQEVKPPKLYEADTLRWQQEYLNAIDSYKKLINTPGALSSAQKNYAINQLVYCYLNTHHYTEAKSYLDQIQLNNLQGLALADFQLNYGKYLKAQGKGLEAIPRVEIADSIYQIYYNKVHLKRLLCITELADLYYHYEDKHNTLEITFQYLNEVGKMLLVAPELKPYAKEYFYLKGYYSYIQRTYLEGINNLNVAIEEANKAPFKDRMFIAKCLSQKGRMYKGIGKRTKALENSNQAIELAEAQNDTTLDIQLVYREHLTLCNKYNENSLFWHYLEKLQKVQKRSNLCINTTRLLALYNYRKGNPEKAIQYFRHTLEQLDNKTIKYNRAKLYDESYFVLATLYKKENLDSVFYFLAKNINRNQGYTPNTLEELLQSKMKTSDVHNFINYAGLADAYAATSKETALKIYTSADSLFFNYSLMANNEAALNFLAEIAAYHYPKAADIAFQLYQETGTASYLSHANLFLERAKAFSLFRDMETFDEDDVYPCSNYELVQEQKELKQQLEELRWKKLKNTSISVDADLQKLLLELPDLSEKIQQNCPSYHSYKLQKNNLRPFEDMEQYVADKKISVLQYSINRNRVTGFLIQQDTTIVSTIVCDSFRTVLQRYRTSLTSSEAQNTSVYLESAHQLYKILIAPFHSLIPTSNRVLIIPDEQLSNIPFEALLTNPIPTNKVNFQTLPYLINDWNIEYTFSVKTFLLNQERKPALKQLSKVLTFSYSSEYTQQKNPTTNRHSEIYSGTTLIKHLAQYPKLKQTSFCGEAASAAHFFDHADKDYDIIQLSLHAEADSLDYLNNQLFFRKLDENAQLSEESIHGFEIKKIQLQAPLVILAACETADGQTQLGDGRFSLARTFLETGARTVLSTLWVTKDFSMKKMLPAFYDSLLLQPEDISAALRKAKLQYIEEASDPTLASPNYWSGFICLN